MLSASVVHRPGSVPGVSGYLRTRYGEAYKYQLDAGIIVGLQVLGGWARCVWFLTRYSPANPTQAGPY